MSESDRGALPSSGALASSAELERLMQGRIYRFSVGFLLALAPIYLSLSWLRPGTPEAAVIWGMCVWLLLNWLWTRRHGDPVRGLLWLHGVNFVILLVGVLWHPGIETPLFWWLTAVPFVSLLSGLTRLGLAQGVLVAVCAATIYFRDVGQDNVDLIGLRLHLAVALTTIYGCGHLAYAMHWRGRLQEALDEARQAALASADAKARFLANMSHEIRTPLNGVIGAAELLRSPQLADGQRVQLAAMQEQSAKTLLALVNDILDWSKLGAGRVELDLQPLSLRGVVFGANELFATAAFEKKIEISSSCDAQVPRLLVGDVARLRQVVNNLVSNAVKFTDKGGVHIHLASDGDAVDGRLPVRIEVSDTGIGIKPEHQGYLFDAFRQAEASTTRRYGGTGLGLTICQELVRLMGGRIEVRSTPGQGSTFSVLLGMAVAAAAQERVPRTVNDAPTLLATASPGLARHLQSLFDELGCPLRTVAGLPGEDEIGADERVLIDVALTEQSGELQRWMALASRKKLRMALLVPLGSDAMAGVLPDATILYKPLRRGALAEFLGQRAAADAKAAATAELPLSRVLVCDDNPVNQLIVQAMLSNLGIDCVIAHDGQQALDRLAAEPFDLVLMDMQMPVIDGLAATREWRRRETPDGPRVTIVAMSAHTEGDQGQACREAGMDGFLAKPFGVAALRRCLEEHGRRRARAGVAV